MIDRVALKMFAQLDDPAPGQRSNAFELLRDHFAKQKPPVKFAHLAADLAGAVPLQKHQELEREHGATMARLQQFEQAQVIVRERYEALEKSYRQVAAENASLRSGVSIFRRLWYAIAYRPRARLAVIGSFVALVLTASGYELFGPQPEPPMSAAALDRLASIRLAKWSADRFLPKVFDLDGAPWWVVIETETDNSSFVGRNDETVALNCYHFFARPAEAAFGSSFKKPPAGFGWKERTQVCVSPQQTASK